MILPPFTEVCYCVYTIKSFTSIKLKENQGEHLSWKHGLCRLKFTQCFKRFNSTRLFELQFDLDMDLCDRITFRLSTFKFWIPFYVWAFFFFFLFFFFLFSINRVKWQHTLRGSVLKRLEENQVSLISFVLLSLVAFHKHYRETFNAVSLSAKERNGGCRWFANLTQPIALFTVNFSHLHYNVIQRGCEAISG